MGYESNEEPMVAGVVYYYDTGKFSSLCFCEKILFALRKHGYDSITDIELGRQEIINGVWQDKVVRYKKNDISVFNLKVELLNWVSDDAVTYISLIHKERRRWMWDVTWHKNYRFPDNVSISDYTFSYLTLVSSYRGIDDVIAQNRYIELFCELSNLFTAFYGRIEDVSTAVDILEQTKEKVFNHRRVQTIYWGNYLGKDFLKKTNLQSLLNIPCPIVKCTDNGIFFALTNDVKDSLISPNYQKRKKLYRLLFKRLRL